MRSARSSLMNVRDIVTESDGASSQLKGHGTANGMSGRRSDLICPKPTDRITEVAKQLAEAVRLAHTRWGKGRHGSLLALLRLNRLQIDGSDRARPAYVQRHCIRSNHSARDQTRPLKPRGPVRSTHLSSLALQRHHPRLELPDLHAARPSGKH